MNELLRALPRVDDVLECITEEKVPHTVLLDCVREVLDNCRNEILKGEHANVPLLSCTVDGTLAKQQIAEMAVELAKSRFVLSLRPVINATGIVLHTNLGRAPMSEPVGEHVKQVAMGYSTLEYDLETGKRGSRTTGIENLLANITKAEAACIVNNNAAGVLLVLSALCQNREVIVSRGELVEIGGSFRVPEVISQGGAILKEIGATNKTRISDYRNAICQETSALLKVHTSNYKIMGFAEEVSLAEMARLAAENNVLSIYDIGSGSFINVGDEPTVQQAVADDVDIICFSGDKLLGGPQCGIILGKKEYIAKVRAHPLYRALRADKLSLAALEASLILYLDLEMAKVQIPTLAMLFASPAKLKEKATQLLGLLKTTHLDVSLQRVCGQAGGGSLPMQAFDSWAIAISAKAGFTVADVEKHLRRHKIPIIARIQRDTLLLDVRTIDEIHFEEIASCLQNYAD